MQQAHHKADHVARSVEVAPLLAGRLGEHVDEELVGRAEQVGKLEFLIARLIPVEKADEILAGVVGNNALVALTPHELNVVEHVQSSSESL